MPFYLTPKQDDFNQIPEIPFEDHMSKFRAHCVYWSVDKFGEKHARPSPKPQDTIICVPVDA